MVRWFGAVMPHRKPKGTSGPHPPISIDTPPPPPPGPSTVSQLNLKLTKWSRTKVVFSLGPPVGSQGSFIALTETTDMFPMIEVANPNAGTPNQEATMLLYRTWTPKDCKKACADIPKPDVDVDECNKQLLNLMRSYDTNGTETQQVLRTILGPKWSGVIGHPLTLEIEGLGNHICIN